MGVEFASFNENPDTYGYEIEVRCPKTDESYSAFKYKKEIYEVDIPTNLEPDDWIFDETHSEFQRQKSSIESLLVEEYQDSLSVAVDNVVLSHFGVINKKRKRRGVFLKRELF